MWDFGLTIIFSTHARSHALWLGSFFRFLLTRLFDIDGKSNLNGTGSGNSSTLSTKTTEWETNRIETEISTSPPPFPRQRRRRRKISKKFWGKYNLVRCQVKFYCLLLSILCCLFFRSVWRAFYVFHFTHKITLTHSFLPLTRTPTETFL